MRETDDTYYPHRERRGANWLGYAAAFGLGVLIGALLFGRGCRGAPEEEKAAETAATAENVAAEAEAPEEVPATLESAATAEEDVIVFHTPEPRVHYPATPAPPAPAPARPRKAAPRAAGKGLTADEINRTITQRRAGIQNEYNTLLKNNPHLGGGKVTVRFTVSSRGDVTSAEIVEDSVGNPALAAAVLRRVGSWKFPRSPGETVVVYPFVFVASGT